MLLQSRIRAEWRSIARLSHRFRISLSDPSENVLDLLTLIASRKPKGGESANDSKDIMGEEGNDLSLRRVWPQEGELRTSTSDDELFLGTRELTQHRLDDVCWWLDRQRVKEHVGGGRHVRGWAQLKPARLWIFCLSMESR